MMRRVRAQAPLQRCTGCAMTDPHAGLVRGSAQGGDGKSDPFTHVKGTGASSHTHQALAMLGLLTCLTCGCSGL